MEIIKLIKNTHGHYSVIFNEIPKVTYEKIGCDYVGSYEENGKIIFSRYLKKDSYGNAFGGREIHLNMKDGTTQTIKDYWFDYGSYEKHGEFIDIGAGTLKDLQKCYVYCSKNINREAFEGMIEEYLTRDKIYDDYRQIEDWCKLQYTWYPVIVRGKRIPFMMNKYGDMVERETKKRVYPRENRSKKINNKYKTYTYFKFKYKENNRTIKIEDNYFEVLKNSLPFSKEEIIINCGLKESYINMNNKISKDCNKKYKASEIIAMIENKELEDDCILVDKDNEETCIKDIKEDGTTIEYLLQYAPFIIKKEEPVAFGVIGVLDTDKKVRVEHELIINDPFFKEYRTFKDILHNGFTPDCSDEFIRKVLKDGKWYVKLHK